MKESITLLESILENFKASYNIQLDAERVNFQPNHEWLVF